MHSTLSIQKALKAAGFDPGPIDGIRGRLTIAAVRRFQIARGLDNDGIVGPVTASALFGGKRATGTVTVGAPGSIPPWYERAMQLKGIHERRDAATVLAMLKRFASWVTSTSTAWCGAFVGACIAETLPDEPMPTNPLGARNWLKFGQSCSPQIGAILIFWRGSKSGWQGHVGFYAGEDKSAYHVLGGNQSDAVTITRISKSRLLGARCPTTMPINGGTVKRAAVGALSTNEA